MTKPTQKNRSKRNIVGQSLLTLLVVAISLATDGFGALPPTQFSEAYRETLGETLPAEATGKVNEYLSEINAATIPAVIKEEAEAETSLPVGLFNEDFLEFLNEILPPEVFAYIVDITTYPFFYVDANAVVALAESTPSVEEIAQTLAAMISNTGIPAAPPPAGIVEGTLSPVPSPNVALTLTPPPLQTPSTIPSLPPTPTIIWYPWTPTSVTIPTAIPTASLIPNQNPTCVGFNHTVPQTTGIINIDLSPLCSDPDGDPWTVTSVTQGTNGTASFALQNILYDPNDGFVGTDNLTFIISDGLGGTYTQMFSITISNLTPIANSDSATVSHNSSANQIDVLANDIDPGNDALTISNFVQPTNGIVATSAGDTMLSYTPNAGYVGLDSFTYTIGDGNGGTDTATVNVNVKLLWCSTSAGSSATEGCTISGIKLNGVAQTSLAVSAPGETFTLEFDYQIWDTLCPTCTVQVMPGIESAFAGSCAYDDVPGAYAGMSGTSSTFTLTAPSTPGNWAVFINPAKNTSCTPSSYLGYGSVIALITVPTAPTTITMYNAGTTNGDIGGRTGADALCAGSRPTGYTKSNAFISVDTTDPISNMAINYSIPTNVEIKSTSDILIANNWSDLVAGTHTNTLYSAGALPSSSDHWWAGGRTGSGGNCVLWTDPTTGASGGLVKSIETGAGWLDGFATSCSADLYLMCVAYP